MAGGMSRYLTAAGPPGGRKRKGETPTGEFVTGSTVSCSSRWVRELVERCCSCTWNLTCSTTGPSAKACECRNAGRKCTGCYCWGKCKNKGQLMSSPTTMRGLLGIFPRVADPPANDPHVTTPPARLPTSLFLQEILEAVAGGRSARRGTSGQRGLREEGRSREWGGGESEVWIGRSDNASDVETEEEGWGHNTLTASS